MLLVSRLCWKFCCKMGPLIAAYCCSIVVGTKSGPIAFLGFRDLSDFISPGCLNVILSMSLNCKIPVSDILSVSSSVNTDSHWSANASTFAVVMVNNFLWCFNAGMPIWSCLLLLIMDQRFFCAISWIIKKTFKIIVVFLFQFTFYCWLNFIIFMPIFCFLFLALFTFFFLASSLYRYELLDIIQIYLLFHCHDLLNIL